MNRRSDVRSALEGMECAEQDGVQGSSSPRCGVTGTGRLAEAPRAGREARVPQSVGT